MNSQYLEKQKLRDFNVKLIRQYIFENHKDTVIKPENQMIREYLLNGKWNI